MNSGFLITDAGLAAAAIATPTGPYVHITEFRVGSAYNYMPNRAQTGLNGTTLHTGVASSYTVVDGDTVSIMLIMDVDIGTFTFGEVGLYLPGGVLFAISVFDTLQEKIRAIGNQAGNVWRIRALITLAQAPAIVQVTLVNSQNILEVPNWQSLFTPINQVMDANIAIVHENNGSEDPILVIRDTDTEWGIVDFSRQLKGQTNDPGFILTGTTMATPDLAFVYFENMPRTDSKYAIKFPDGSIRKITASLSPTQIEFAPAVAVQPIGTYSIWAAGGEGNGRISWTDTPEYNLFIERFNLYWGTPIGPYQLPGANLLPYPEYNRGSNQVPYSALARRTNTSDWQALVSAVRRKCQLHDIDITDLSDVIDFVYRPSIPPYTGISTLSQQWGAMLTMIGELSSNRNIFDLAMLETSLRYNTPYTLFWLGLHNFDFNHDYFSRPNLQGMLNSGHEIRISGSVAGATNPAWIDFATFLVDMGTVRITQDGVTAAVGTVAFFGLQQLTEVFQTLWSRTANNWTMSIQARTDLVNNRIVIRCAVDNTADAPVDYGPTPGSIIFNMYSYRASSAILNDPVLSYPNVTLA